MSDLQKLRAKLCRELSQSEHSAIVQPRREANRLGAVPPAAALRAIADHAERMRPRFDKLITGERATSRGVAIGRFIGEMFSVLRHGLFDRLIDRERSYRGTLLGAVHGADLVRLLQAVARAKAIQRSCTSARTGSPAGSRSSRERRMRWRGSRAIRVSRRRRHEANERPRDTGLRGSQRRAGSRSTCAWRARCAGTPHASRH